MSNKTAKIIFVTLIILTALFFGNFQEKIKLGINNLIELSAQIPSYDTYSSEVREKMVDDIIRSKPIDFFNSQSPPVFFFKKTRSELSSQKWVWAFVFIGAFFIFNALGLFVLFKNKQLILFLALSYTGLAILSFAFFALGSLAENPLSGYGVARKILGTLQSLVPSMILIPVYIIFEKQKSEIPNE